MVLSKYTVPRLYDIDKGNNQLQMCKNVNFHEKTIHVDYTFAEKFTI